MEEWQDFLRTGREAAAAAATEEARGSFQAQGPKNFCEIPLRNKQKEIVGWAKCSPEHYEELMKYKWYRDKSGYARTNWNTTSITMHQYLKQKGLPPNHVIDHINSDRLDNRISNFEICNCSPKHFEQKTKKHA